MKPKILPPIDDFDPRRNISQYFGVNAKRYRTQFGAPGHQAIDVVNPDDKLGYGTKIIASHKYDWVDRFTDFPNKTKGTGIYLKGQLEVPYFVHGVTAHYIETINWHLADFVIGENVKSGNAGDVVALMGNSGYVFPKPSNACPLCPYYGTHSHFGCRFRDMQGNIIENSQTYPRGYVDPIPYMYNDGDRYNFRFTRNLFYGRSGDDVSWLQTILKIEGFGEDYEPIGFFGRKTVRDVIKLQNKYGIEPAHGFVGPITRSFLTGTYT